MNQRVLLKKRVLWSLSISILLISAMPSGLFPTTVDQVPASVHKGDIIFMDIKPGVGEKKSYLKGTSNDHCALYLGHDYLDGNQFVEASHSGVGTISYSTLKDWYENFTFYEVATASDTQKAAAVQWAMGSPPSGEDNYQYWFHGMRKCNDPYGWPITSNLWYCSELVWAAYYNQGFDIDYNDWTIDFLGTPSVIIGHPTQYVTNQLTADPVVQFICSD